MVAECGVYPAWDLNYRSQALNCQTTTMSPTMGYHVVKSTYGTWLPGDPRGSWSETWSPERGYFGAHQFHEGDQRRLAMALQRMKHPPVVLTDAMCTAIREALQYCVERAKGELLIMAAAIEPTHMHLLIPHTGRDIHTTVKWIADQTSKAVHRRTAHLGPVWTKNHWCHHIDRQEHWENAAIYVDEHNRRAGRGSRPYAFLAPLEV
jgi:REP element-mobilizing transposase RayT